MAAVLEIRDVDGNIVSIPAIRGARGKSAYEIAVDHGFEGTEEEWLESLHGTGTGSGGITSETDPTVPAWAKEPNPPTYTAEDVGALPNTTVIPTKTSELENDSRFVTTSHFRPKSKCFYTANNECEIIGQRTTNTYNQITVILKTDLPEKMLFASDVALIDGSEKEYNIITGVDNVEFFNHPEYNEEYDGWIIAIIDAYKYGEIYGLLSVLADRGIKLYYI